MWVARFTSPCPRETGDTMTKHQETIVTVGSLAFDSIRTPVGKVESVLGGAVNYFSVAASFYYPVSLVAVVGQDFQKTI